MNKNLIFFETQDQVKLFFQNYISHYREHNLKFIALTPIAMKELEELNVKFTFPEQYYNCNDEYKKLSLEFDHDNEKFVETMDNMILKRYKAFSHENLRPFECYGYYWKMLFDNVKVKLFQVYKIIEKEEPFEILLFNTDVVPIGVDLQFSTNESVYYHILKLLAQEFSFKIKILKYSQENKQGINIRKFLEIRKYLKRKVYFFYNYMKRKQYFCDYLKNILEYKFRKKEHNILIIKMNNISVIKNKLKRNRFKIYKIRQKYFINYFLHPTEQNEMIFNFIKENNSEHSHLFSFCNINFYKIIEERLLFFINRIDIIYRIYLQFKEYLSVNRIDLIFTDTVLLPLFNLNLVLVSAAKRLGIPVVCWIHGGTIYNNVRNWDCYELKYVDYYFVYGRKNKEIFEKLHYGSKVKYFITGSAFIPNKQSKSPKNKNSILYIMKGFSGNRHYLGWENEEMWSDNMFYIHSKKIIDNLLKIFPDRHLTIKLHAANLILTRYEKLYERYADNNRVRLICDQDTLENLLPLFQLVVYDWISTSFFQSTIYENDIFVYTLFNIDLEEYKYCHNRAYLYKKEKDFVNALISYREYGDFKNKRQDTTFIKEFLDIDPDNRNKLSIPTILTRILADKNTFYSHEPSGQAYDQNAVNLSL